MKIGDVVPDFELKDQTGKLRKFSEMYATGPVVVFFYPAAMTYGCTKESCHFRDVGAEFNELGAMRVGISADTVEKQKQFSDKHGFDYPLLADPDQVAAEIFGVKRKSILGNRRSSFVVDTDGKVIGAFSADLRFNAHAERALDVLRSRQKA